MGTGIISASTLSNASLFHQKYHRSVGQYQGNPVPQSIFYGLALELSYSDNESAGRPGTSSETSPMDP